MPSQIKVDEIKNVAGQYKIKTDTFEGQTTAGSIAVQGEGTATTNLQQGLAKSWVNFTMASTPSANDSFNLASITDVATGKAGLVVTSVFANTNYSVQGHSNGTTADNFTVAVQVGLKCNFNVTTSTSTYEFSIYAADYVDAIHNYSDAHGDLA